MREKEKTRVIWRHPRGRFEIQETEHYSSIRPLHILHARMRIYAAGRCARAVQRGADSHLCAGGNQAGGSVAAARDGRGKTAACENVSSRHAYSRYFTGRPDELAIRSQTYWRSWAAGRRSCISRFTGRMRNFRRRQLRASAAICGARRSARRSARAIMPCKNKFAREGYQMSLQKIREAVQAAEGNARQMGEVVLMIAQADARRRGDAADLDNPEMSFDKCFSALL